VRGCQLDDLLQQLHRIHAQNFHPLTVKLFS